MFGLALSSRDLEPTDSRIRHHDSISGYAGLEMEGSTMPMIHHTPAPERHKLTRDEAEITLRSRMHGAVNFAHYCAWLVKQPDRTLINLAEGNQVAPPLTGARLSAVFPASQAGRPMISRT
jgi:hypothetical protein